jgi:hypothetical protein
MNQESFGRGGHCDCEFSGKPCLATIAHVSMAELLSNTEMDDWCRMTLVIPARGQAFEGRFERRSMFA